MNIRHDKRNKYYLIATATLLTGIMITVAGSRSPARAQGVSRVSEVTPMRGRSFESRFWSWLQSVQYRNWSPAPGKNGDTYAGQSPHGAFLKLYLNRTAAGRSKELPHGSIIVKENFGPDKKTLMAVTVMYRSKSFDAEHNDWYWVKYNPDGSVATTPPEKGSKRIAGRFPSCIECHGGAEGNDYSFMNDE